MPSFLDKLRHTHHDDKHKHDSASASSERTSPDSKHLLAQSPSPPPYTEVSKNQPSGLSCEDKAAAPQSPGAIDKTFQTEVGVRASYSGSQSNSTGIDAGPSSVRTSLQLCQHEDLTFERLQFIKDMLYDNYPEKGIDIIKNLEEKQHGVMVKGGEYLWACHADDDLKHTGGTFKMKLSSKPRRFLFHSKGPVIGLELYVHWEIDIARATWGNTRDEINLYFQKLDKVPLCPHTMMNDPWIQEKIYNFRKVRDVPKPSGMDEHIQRTHKSKPPPPQPPQGYDCIRCKTHVEVSYKLDSFYDEVFVKITRHLGEGVVENDPTWLAQCGIEP